MEENNPHDWYFKRAFGDAEAASELASLGVDNLGGRFPAVRLRKFQLPPDDERGEDLRNVRVDLLFEAGSDPDSPLAYVLYEHKSSPERDVTLQTLGYMATIWSIDNRYRRWPLRPIVPVIVYHGKQSWSAPRAFSESVQDPEFYWRQVPNFHPYFVEVHEVPEAAVARLSEYTRTAVAALRYHRGHERAEMEKALWLPKASERQARMLRLFFWTFEYLLKISTEAERAAILKTAERFAGREVRMTAYESIIEEGREQGILQGILQGKLTGEREVLTRLMAKKFRLDDADRKLISEAQDLEKLAQALDEIIVADTKEQVLSKLR